MKSTRILNAAIGTLLVATAAAFAPAASANGNVGWSVSIGVPGLAVTAGQPAFGPWFGAPFRPVGRSVVVAPPVVYRPWLTPVPVVVPYRVYAPRPAFYGRPIVAPLPYRW